MDCKTEKGLLFLIIGTIVTMIYGLFSSIISFITQDETVTIIRDFLPIISFIGVILIIIGAIIFLLGRREFGETHQNNVMKAVIIFCINFIIIVILTIIISFVVYSAVSGIVSTGEASSSTNVIAEPLSYFIIIIAITSAILGGLMYYFALIELEDERGKNVLFAAIIVSIVISTITSLYIAGILGEIFGSISTDVSSYSSLSFTQDVGKIGILGVISNLLFIYALYIPYKRIKDGELVPVISSTGYQSAPSRICPNCNRNIPNDANICPYCGKQFESFLK